MKKLNILLDLFITFFKIGLFTFGGGYAMIPLIEDACVEKKKWITNDEMMNVTVVAESTPGPIAINCATFVGYKKGGFLGSVIASIGVVLPSFIIIFAISKFLDNFLEITVIANAFKGIKIAVGLLIIDAGIKFIKKMKKTVLAVLITVLSAALMLIANFMSFNISTITLMLVSAIVALSVCFISGRQKGGADK